MNLRRHLNVLRRFRLIVAGGFLLGVALAIFAIFKVSPSGLEWRSKQTFQSTSALNVTQHGFPDGRVILGDTGTAKPGDGTAAPTDEEAAKADQFADPGRFANLAVTYAYYAQSDAVRDLIKPTPKREQVTITPAPAGWNTTATLPILTLLTTANDPGNAKKLNAAVIEALTQYIEREQAKNKIPPDNRVRVEVLSPPSDSIVLIGHSKTPAIVAFILVMAAALALSYCLDNLYPGTGQRAGEMPLPAGEAARPPATLAPVPAEQHGLSSAPAAPPAEPAHAGAPGQLPDLWSAPPASRRAG